jgi:hypothetical protein
MPKIQVNTSSISTQTYSDVLAGSYINIESLSIGVNGRITSITTSSIVVTYQAGIVNSLNGTAGRITVSTTTDYPIVNLGTVGGVAGTYNLVNSITIDSYGRATSIATSTVVTPGVYPYPQSITVDAQNRITSITTGTSVPVAIDYHFASSSTQAPPSFGANYFGKVTKIQQSIDLITTATSTSTSSATGITYTLDMSTATVFYLTPTNNFTFEVLYGPYYGSYDPNSGTTLNTIQTLTVIVNNTGGYSYKIYPLAGGTSGGRMRFPAGGSYINLCWIMGVVPTGVAGRTEVYSFTWSYYNQKVYASMTTYG